MAEKEGGLVKSAATKKASNLTSHWDFSPWKRSLRTKKLKGVKAKELMLWPPVSEIIDNDSGKLDFKSLAGITKTFPAEAFAAGQLFYSSTARVKCNSYPSTNTSK
ncbi:hypothetical protein QQ045_009781 [Rhodiola kirilowii]